MIRRHLAVWSTGPWLGTIVGTLAVVAVIGGGAIVVALVGTGGMLAAALGGTFLASSWTTGRLIGPRPAVASGAPTPSRRAPASAAPRHRARHAALGWSAWRAPYTSVAATLAPTTGRPPTGGSAAHLLPAAASPAASPLYAAAGSTPALAMPVSPTKYAPGRVLATTIHHTGGTR